MFKTNRTVHHFYITAPFPPLRAPAAFRRKARQRTAIDLLFFLSPFVFLPPQSRNFPAFLYKMPKSRKTVKPAQNSGLSTSNAFGSRRHSESSIGTDDEAEPLSPSKSQRLQSESSLKVIPLSYSISRHPLTSTRKFHSRNTKRRSRRLLHEQYGL